MSTNLKKIRAPITVFHDGAYVPPGTLIEVSEDEAARLAAAHGEYGGANVDPASTQFRAVDEASIKSLNENAGIHGGHGHGRR